MCQTFVNPNGLANKLIKYYLLLVDKSKHPPTNDPALIAKTASLLRKIRNGFVHFNPEISHLILLFEAFQNFTERRLPNKIINYIVLILSFLLIFYK